MFEVLVYLFENYFEVNVRPDHHTLSKELYAAGFDEEDINGAFDWFTALEAMSATDSAQQSGSVRIYAEAERKKINQQALGFLIFLEQTRVLSPAQRELVIDRALALPQPEVGIEETRWIVLMTLRNQGTANDYLFVEDAVFGDSQPTLH